MVYRTFSPWQHTEAASFKATALIDPDGRRFLGDISQYEVEHPRVMAGAQFAYVLEILGLTMGDGSDAPARMLRHFLLLFSDGCQLTVVGLGEPQLTVQVRVQRDPFQQDRCFDQRADREQWSDGSRATERVQEVLVKASGPRAD